MMHASDKLHQEHTETVASFPSYALALEALNHMKDNGFPIQYASIAAEGLQPFSQNAVRSRLFQLSLSLVAALATGFAMKPFFELPSIASYAAGGEYEYTVLVTTLSAVTALIVWLIHFALSRKPHSGVSSTFRAQFFDVVTHDQYSAAAKDALGSSVRRRASANPIPREVLIHS